MVLRACASRPTVRPGGSRGASPARAARPARTLSRDSVSWRIVSICPSPAEQHLLVRDEAGETHGMDRRIAAHRPPRSPAPCPTARPSSPRCAARRSPPAAGASPPRRRSASSAPRRSRSSARRRPPRPRLRERVDPLDARRSQPVVPTTHGSPRASAASTFADDRVRLREVDRASPPSAIESPSSTPSTRGPPRSSAGADRPRADLARAAGRSTRTDVLTPPARAARDAIRSTAVDGSAPRPARSRRRRSAPGRAARRRARRARPARPRRSRR